MRPLNPRSLISLVIVGTIATALCGCRGTGQRWDAGLEERVADLWAKRAVAIRSVDRSQLLKTETGAAFALDDFYFMQYCPKQCGRLEASQPRDLRIVATTPGMRYPRRAVAELIDNAVVVPQLAVLEVLGVEQARSGVPFRISFIAGSIDDLSFDTAATPAAMRSLVRTPVGMSGLAAYWQAVAHGRAPPPAPSFATGRVTSGFAKLLGTRSRATPDETNTDEFRVNDALTLPFGFSIDLSNGRELQCGVILETAMTHAVTTTGLPNTHFGDLAAQLAPGNYRSVTVRGSWTVCLTARAEAPLVVRASSSTYFSVQAVRA